MLTGSHYSVFHIIHVSLLDRLCLISQFPADDAFVIIGQVVILVVFKHHRLMCQIVCRQPFYEVLMQNVKDITAMQHIYCTGFITQFQRLFKNC